MDVNEQISQVIQKRLGGDYSVETRVNYWQYDENSKADAGFIFVVKNPLVESDPEQAKKQILEALGKIEPLKAHIVVESETNHMERLAKELEYFRAQELAVNSDVTTIHSKAPEWFRELPKRDRWDIKHALNVRKSGTGIINIDIATPKDATVEDIAKNIENRKAAIMAVLIDRVVKYTPTADTPEKKEALKAQVNRLEFNITASSSGDSKSVHIEIMSPEQLAQTKLPGGITDDKVQSLNTTNPLLALQNGEDDQDPDKTKPQPHLQKALARAILYAGDKHEEILPFIAGKEDMRRMVGKSLTNLKAKMSTNAELVKRIDAFLGDEVFKDHRTWGKPIEKQEDIPEAPRFNKMVGDITDTSKPYEKGIMTVTVKLPADKFPAIRDQIAALDGAAAGQTAASADNINQAVDSRIKPLVEALVTTIQNQQQIANHMVEQETKAAASQSMMEKAIVTLSNATNQLVSWAKRVEARTNPPPVATAPATDEAMANTVLAAAGVATTPQGTVAGAIAGGAPTVEGWGKLLEAQKAAQENAAAKGSGISAA